MFFRLLRNLYKKIELPPDLSELPPDLSELPPDLSELPPDLSGGQYTIS